MLGTDTHGFFDRAVGAFGDAILGWTVGRRCGHANVMRGADASGVTGCQFGSVVGSQLSDLKVRCQLLQFADAGGEFDGCFAPQLHGIRECVSGEFVSKGDIVTVSAARERHGASYVAVQSFQKGAGFVAVWLDSSGRRFGHFACGARVAECRDRIDGKGVEVAG